ncbi:MAG: long-chain fatty acid--CoA ligase [Pseudomonadota bacterium]
MDCDEITAELLSFISNAENDDDAFEVLAHKVFQYQFENNGPFAKFARSRGRTPRTVKSWADIPAVPINAFKTMDLTCCNPDQAAAIFMTSGTTQGGVRGKNYHSTLRVYDASMKMNFQRRIMNGQKQMEMGILFPTPDAMPNSSLAHYLNLAVTEFGTRESGHFIEDEAIDFKRLIDTLRDAEGFGQPYALLGASFSLVHVLDELHKLGAAFKLPEGSLVMDTGGYKGQSRELNPDDFYNALAQTFGVPRSRCVNMYGMTELSTQFYDDGNEQCPSIKSGPSWIRTRVTDPLTGSSVPKGEVGILAHTDLANFNSAVTILTEDSGIETDEGFILLGRASGSEAQGCSMAVDEFLKVAGAA